MYFMGFSKWLLLSSRLVAGELVTLKWFLPILTQANKSNYCVHTQPSYLRGYQGDIAMCVACPFVQHRKVSP